MLPSRQLSATAVPAFLAFHVTHFGYFFGQGLSPALSFHAQQQPSQL
jgi:hypothetical protein